MREINPFPAKDAILKFRFENIKNFIFNAKRGKNIFYNKL